MKGKLILGALAAIGVFALSATAVQAGSGQGVPASLTTFFQCQVIDGQNINQQVITCNPGSTCRNTIPGDPRPDSAFGQITPILNIGSGVLICRQVDVRSATLVPALADGTPGFLKPDAAFDIKCYTTAIPGRKGASDTEKLVDAFVTENATVTQQPGYLCAPFHIPPPPPPQ